MYRRARDAAWIFAVIADSFSRYVKVSCTPIVTLLDGFDLAIVRELAVDGRVSFRELARCVGLSTPAVTT
jgi:hypothetical protein